MKQEKKSWNSSTSSFILVATAQSCNHELNSTFLVQVICNWKFFVFVFVCVCFCFLSFVCFVLFCFCSSAVFLFILICVIFFFKCAWYEIISHCTLTEYYQADSKSFWKSIWQMNVLYFQTLTFCCCCCCCFFFCNVQT